ncbi:ROK family protein [Candidatus Enterococcus ferrettii]|uniref:ROK family protein n=1 Tax=Candidatus Enterococcus ferrettii TaxID=2815324 RepID=A0ABV0ETV6_9ENTE|nr:ROK family protein [Enterococcus sp. 665A]MBO1341772.1 ROK family protein [Enterococcus sp. 665A]
MALAVFDIGGTSVKYARWQSDQLSQKGSFATPETFEEMVLAMKERLQQIPKVTGVAISSPGAVNVAARQIEGVSALGYLHFRPIFDELEAELGLPVTIENDANCAGISEMVLGAGQHAKHAVFIIIGTGIGGAVFIDRKLHKGRHLFGGEFGLMKPYGQTILSKLGTAVNTANAFSQNTGIQLTGIELFARADAGDEQAKQYLAAMYDSIGLTLYNLQVALDPEIVMIGGGVSTREDVITNIKKRLYHYLAAESVEEIMPEVVACQYQNDANLIGAAIHFEAVMK